MFDCDIVLSEFKLQWHHIIHFRSDNPEKSIYIIIPLTVLSTFYFWGWAEKFIWWHHICCWWPFCTTGFKHWTLMEEVSGQQGELFLKIDPILVSFHESILVNLWTFHPTRLLRDKTILTFWFTYLRFFHSHIILSITMHMFFFFLFCWIHRLPLCWSVRQLVLLIWH